MIDHSALRALAQRSFSASEEVIAACHRISIPATSSPGRRDEPGAFAPFTRPALNLTPKASDAPPASPYSSGSALEAGRPANRITLA